MAAALNDVPYRDILFVTTNIAKIFSGRLYYQTPELITLRCSHHKIGLAVAPLMKMDCVANAELDEWMRPDPVLISSVALTIDPVTGACILVQAATGTTLLKRMLNNWSMANP